MKLHSLALATLALLNGPAVLAADAAAASGATTSGMLRLLKTDGSTVVSQAILAPGVMQQISVKASDAIAAANGRCAFNVRIDAVSPLTLAGTTTRLYSNDTLVANVTRLDLLARTLKSYVTQPYLYAGRNNLKVVFNAESAVPSVAWVQVLVDGSCVAAKAPEPAPLPAPVKAGTADWNALFNAYGTSNYAVTGLKGKGYRRYDDLAAVNAALVAAVKAGSIERAAYATLMSRWLALVNDADFRAAMQKLVPGNDRRG